MINYYKDEFTSPNPALESKLEKELSPCLKKHKPLIFVSKPSDVSFYCKKTKEKKSS